MGVMQLIPETASRFNVKDSYDPVENIKGGLAYLRWLLAYYQGNVALAVAGYNAGEGAVDRYRGVPLQGNAELRAADPCFLPAPRSPLRCPRGGGLTRPAGAQGSGAVTAAVGAKGVGFRVLGVCLAWFLPVSAMADFPDTVAQVKRSVVAVGTFMPSRNPQFRFLGTGFVVGDGKQVATNAHVIAAAPDSRSSDERLVVAQQSSSGRASVRPVERDERDPDHDLAVLWIGGAPMTPAAGGFRNGT
jgi:hypothetical protein